MRAAMGFAAIHMAASQGHWQAVVMLLKHGASLAVRCYGVLRADFSVPARWKPNSTPLHIAAARGSTSMVKHMLQSFVRCLPHLDPQTPTPPPLSPPGPTPVCVRCACAPLLMSLLPRSDTGFIYSCRTYPLNDLGTCS